MLQKGQSLFQEDLAHAHGDAKEEQGVLAVFPGYKMKSAQLDVAISLV